MKVKLVKSSLIRSFGGVIVDMTDSQAVRYINRGDAIAYTKSANVSSSDRHKSIRRPTENKMVWSPPEEKLFEVKEDDKENKIFPGPDDKLFSQIKVTEV